MTNGHGSETDVFHWKCNQKYISDLDMRQDLSILRQTPAKTGNVLEKSDNPLDF